MVTFLAWDNTTDTSTSSIDVDGACVAVHPDENVFRPYPCQEGSNGARVVCESPLRKFAILHNRTINSMFLYLFLPYYDRCFIDKWHVCVTLQYAPVEII